MVANIFLHPDNFRYNKVDDEDYLASKLKSLVNDLEEVVYKRNEENKFFVLSGFFDVDIFYKKQIIPFADKHLIGDEKGVLYAMLANEADGTTTMSLEELEAKCNYSQGEEHPTSMVVLNVPKIDNDLAADKEEYPKEYIQFEHYEIIYGKNNWRTFRRQILGNHPGDDYIAFINDCEKYFPNISFHSNCTNSLAYKEFDCINTCPRKIIYYLSCLNDCYHLICKEYHDFGKNTEPNDILADFSGRYGLDRAASIQGQPASKDSRTFTFKHPDGKQEIEVLCDLHFKITSPDTRYRGRICDNYNPRIYFGIRPNADYSSVKIYVGSIGEHL